MPDRRGPLLQLLSVEARPVLGAPPEESFPETGLGKLIRRLVGRSWPPQHDSRLSSAGEDAGHAYDPYDEKDRSCGDPYEQQGEITAWWKYGVAACLVVGL